MTDYTKMTPTELANHREKEKAQLTKFAKSIVAMILHWNECYGEATGIRFTVKGWGEK